MVDARHLGTEQQGPPLFQPLGQDRQDLGIAPGEDHLVTVAFKGSHGIKKLLLSYAPLEKLP